jgi:hypothetical protein
MRPQGADYIENQVSQRHTSRFPKHWTGAGGERHPPDCSWVGTDREGDLFMEFVAGWAFGPFGCWRRGRSFLLHQAGCRRTVLHRGFAAIQDDISLVC